MRNYNQQTTYRPWDSPEFSDHVHYTIDCIISASVVSVCKLGLLAGKLAGTVLESTESSERWDTRQVLIPLHMFLFLGFIYLALIKSPSVPSVEMFSKTLLHSSEKSCVSNLL